MTLAYDRKMALSLVDKAMWSGKDCPDFSCYFERWTNCSFDSAETISDLGIHFPIPRPHYVPPKYRHQVDHFRKILPPPISFSLQGHFLVAFSSFKILHETQFSTQSDSQGNQETCWMEGWTTYHWNAGLFRECRTRMC